MRRLLAILVAMSAAAACVGAAVAVPVAVGHSSLAIPCGAPVQADWYKPAGTVTGLVWVQHGFSGSKSDVAGFAQDIAAHTGALVVAPTITSDQGSPCWLGSATESAAVATLLVGDRAALIASARAAGYGGVVPRPFVMTGHSLGGAFSLYVGAAAPTDLRAVVVLDGGSLDPANAQAVAALAALNGKAVLTVASPHGTVCNPYDLGPVITAARPGQFVGVELVGGLHMDAIGYSSFLGNLLCGWSRLENVAAVQTIASQWVTNALTGTTSGITAGTPGQLIPVGQATAKVLG